MAIIDVEPDRAGNAGNPHDERVAAWQLISADMLRGQCGRTTRRTGEGGASLLSALASLCSSKEQTWVIIPDAVRGLAASGLFRALSAGDWLLCGKDWKADRGIGKSGEDRTSGLCVIEDPPTLILCQPTGRPGKLLLLDTRNYGIGHEFHDYPIAARCAHYMAGILSIVSALRTDRSVSLRGTAASQAVQILRTRYDCRALYCHNHNGATALERAAYFGGRAEAYRTGRIEGPVYSLDVRSMYASIMCDLPVPVSIRDYADESGYATEVVGRDPSACIAHARVWCDEPRIPVRRDGSIAYPHGESDAYISGPELLSAFRAGLVRQVYSAVRYTCAPILRDFARDIIATTERFRAAGNTIGVAWAKRVANALPGKFGEPGRRWVGCPPRTERDEYCEWIEPGPDGKPARHRRIAGYEQREEVYGESYWSMPAVAGWITSAARLRLWHYIEAAGRENVWYVDTDGLLCGEAGYDRLLRSGLIGDGAPGDLRLVGSYSSATIYGVRHYQLGDTIRCAGVPRGAIGPGETREDYWRLHPATAETTLERIRRMSGG